MQSSIDVVIIDDSDADTRLTVRAVHAAIKHPAVTRLKDGSIASQFMFRNGMFQERPDVLPRLILLELAIPVVDGMELMRQLRRAPETREIPVIVLSKIHNPVAVSDAYAAGARAYLPKPLDEKTYLFETELLVKRWLRPVPNGN